MTRYYDTRYLLLPVFTFLKTYSSSSSADAADVKSTDESSFLSKVMSLALISVPFLLFLTVTVRIQFCCFFHPLARVGQVELGIGGTKLSVPVTLSLIVTLLAPSSSAFWSIYLVILLASLFSDAFDSFLMRLSYHQCFVVLPRTSFPDPHEDEEQALPGHQV